MGYTSTTESNSVSTVVRASGIKVISFTKKPGAASYPPCGAFNPPPQIASGLFTTTITRTRSKTLNYRPSRYVPPTPYNFKKVVNMRRGLISGLGEWDLWDGCVARISFQGVSSDHVYPALPNPSQASIDSTLVKAANSILDQKVNFAQAFAERRQALSMVTRRVQQLANAARAVRQGKFSKAAKILQCDATPSSIWLEWRYGWRPLLSDVYGTLELIQKIDQENPDRYVISGKGTYTMPLAPSLVNVSVNCHTSDAVLAFPAVRERKNAKVGVFSRLDYQVPRTSVLRTLVSTGITDPLSLAWELTPYSFVVDWFVNVGDWLGFQTFDTGLSFVGGSTSIIKRQTVEWTPKSSFALQNGSQRFSGVSGKLSVSEVILDRKVYTTRPSLNVSWNPRISNSRFLDALALLSQEMRQARR